eukprot:SAG31_NODE_683_length_12836_cov_8.304938_8_plen_102_part_00
MNPISTVSGTPGSFAARALEEELRGRKVADPNQVEVGEATALWSAGFEEQKELKAASSGYLASMECELQKRQEVVRDATRNSDNIGALLSFVMFVCFCNRY